ncbi:MAG: M42 family metallopeptidase [Candidatus Coatesbacteria bacterium]
MERNSLAFLERFMAIPSPSGAEEAAAREWAAWMKPAADRIEKDTHGNVMAVLNPRGTPRVMLAGHMDEIGFMITQIGDDGFLHFAQVGGHDLQIIQGMRVAIRTAKGTVKGLLGKKAIHLMSGEEGRKVPSTEDLWIDIGVKDRKEAKGLVEIGDWAVIDMGYEPMRNGFATARGFDDRIGAWVVGEALRILSKKRPAASVYAVATVQEEIGLRGARTSAFGIDPLVGIAVDVTHATDNPGAGGKEKAKLGTLKLGGGPVLARGPNINPKVYSRLQDAAKAAKIAVQVEAAPGGTGTDANVMQTTRAGIATGLVSIPLRYMHTPCEMLALRDVEDAAKLIAEFIARLDRKANFIPSEP